MKIKTAFSVLLITIGALTASAAIPVTYSSVPGYHQQFENRYQVDTYYVPGRQTQLASYPSDDSFTGQSGHRQHTYIGPQGNSSATATINLMAAAPDRRPAFRMPPLQTQPAMPAPAKPKPKQWPWAYPIITSSILRNTNGYSAMKVMVLWYPDGGQVQRTSLYILESDGALQDLELELKDASRNRTALKFHMHHDQTTDRGRFIGVEDEDGHFTPESAVPSSPPAPASPPLPPAPPLGPPSPPPPPTP